MTKDVSVVITGSSGFIGRSFIESYSNLDLYRTKRKKNNQITFEHIKSSSESDYLDIDNDFVLLHLATYFSKNVEDKSLITNANIDFGENLINKLQNSKLRKLFIQILCLIFTKILQLETFITQKQNRCLVNI